MEDLTGRQLGPYQVVAPLGEGGMAAVFKAYQPGVERYVALKVLPRHFAEEPEFAARFLREAKILAQLQHPHILPVFDYGQDEGYSYIVMPFVPSGTLTQSLAGRPLPLSRIRQVITQLGDALHYAHRRSLVHRDIKPSNVLVDESGNCLLTDFGLARMVEDSVNLTATGTILGTPAYMSPEQGSGRSIDARSDIYALGIILYEMATGRVPYKAETPVAVVYMHVTGPLPLPRRVNPDLPESVERVILKALAKNPEDRYQTAHELTEALQRAIPEASRAKGAPEPRPAAKRAREALSPTLVAPPGDRAIAPGASRRRARAWPWIVAIGSVGVLAAGAIVLAKRPMAQEASGVAQTPVLAWANGTASTAPAVPSPHVAGSSPTPRSTATTQPAAPFACRIRITTSSDWTMLRLAGGAGWEPKVVWASSGANLAELDAGQLWLGMPIEQAGGSQSVSMIVNVGLRDVAADGRLVLEMEKGALGSTQVEVLNTLGESPISVSATESQTPVRIEVPAGSLMQIREVTIDLGQPNQTNGVTQVGILQGDGVTAPAEIGGKDARVTVTNGSPARYMYFAVEDAFLRAEHAPVSVTIEYFDQRAGNQLGFAIEYDSGGTGTAACYKQTGFLRLTDTGTWKTVTIDLPDAYFGGCQNFAADFRISTSDRDLYINRVTVTK
jgi:hypothetical protein